MYCRKCDKTLPADSTFCPYCGNEKLEADPIPEEEAPVEETSAESEVPEEEVPAEEISAEPEAVEDPPVAPAPDAERIVEGKSGKNAVLILLSVLVVLAAIACAFLLGLTMNRGDTPAVTTDGVVTTDAPVEDADLFPTDYTTAYPDGYVYADADLSQHVTLGKYKDLTVTLTTSSEITEADVEAYIQNVLAQYTTTEEVDRAAEKGDTVVIDYVGRTMDGVAFEGGTASNQTLSPLGSAGYIPGFEDGIVGMTAGETKVIDVTFPEQYHEELAGKDAQFTITLHTVKAAVVPEYNDAFVREHFDYATMPEYEMYVREVLKQNREAEILAEKQDGVLSIAMDNATVHSYPENLVEDYMFQQIDYVRQYAAMYGMTYADFTEQAIGMTAAAYEAEVRASAESSVKQEMVVFAIAAAEGLTVSAEDRAEAEGYYLSYYGAEDIASLCSTLGITEQYFANTIDFSVTFANVMDFLTENATFTGAK